MYRGVPHHASSSDPLLRTAHRPKSITCRGEMKKKEKKVEKRERRK
jgi:hypothetical protein